jgi:nucleoid-associated protein EbfC
MAKGGFDPNEIMAQARKMKDEMARVQDQLKERVVDAEAGDGLVKVFANGSSEIVGVKIDPEAIDMDDLSELEDLVMIAANKALEKAGEMSNGEMNKITGGLGGLGGLF